MRKTLFLFAAVIISISCNDTSNNAASGLNAEETVKEFVKLLGDQKYKDAYDLTKNPKWGDYSKFSSKKAFGAINKTTIYETKTEKNSDQKATIYADVKYFDNVNGTNRFKQYFYLQKKDENWKIIDMKLAENSSGKSNKKISLPTKGVYTNGTIFFIVNSTKNNKIKGTLFNRENWFYAPKLELSLNNKKSLVKKIESKYECDIPSCEVEFIFDKNSITLKSKSDGFGKKSVLKKSNKYKTPSVGTYEYEQGEYYGTLEINEVDKDANVFFNMYVGKGAACTGDLSELHKATGINGVYIYEGEEEDGDDACTLFMTFTDSKAKVTEISCSLYHGASCAFGGEFHKK